MLQYICTADFIENTGIGMRRPHIECNRSALIAQGYIEDIRLQAFGTEFMYGRDSGVGSKRKK